VDAGEGEAWVTELRARLGRGDLAKLGPLQLWEDVPPMPGELMVRIMLADLDHFADLTPTHRAEPGVQRRRRALLEDFARLRSLVE
jgi:hypothetical protein